MLVKFGCGLINLWEFRVLTLQVVVGVVRITFVVRNCCWFVARCPVVASLFWCLALLFVWVVLFCVRICVFVVTVFTVLLICWYCAVRMVACWIDAFFVLDGLYGCY